jgi:hypothetical protein
MVSTSPPSMLLAWPKLTMHSAGRTMDFYCCITIYIQDEMEMCVVRATGNVYNSRPNCHLPGAALHHASSLGV